MEKSLGKRKKDSALLPPNIPEHIIDCFPPETDREQLTDAEISRIPRILNPKKTTMLRHIMTKLLLPNISRKSQEPARIRKAHKVQNDKKNKTINFSSDSRKPEAVELHFPCERKYVNLRCSN